MVLNILVDDFHVTGPDLHALAQFRHQRESLGLYGVALHIAFDHLLIPVAIARIEVRGLQMAINHNHRVGSYFQEIGHRAVSGRLIGNDFSLEDGETSVKAHIVLHFRLAHVERVGIFEIFAPALKRSLLLHIVVLLNANDVGTFRLQIAEHGIEGMLILIVAAISAHVVADHAKRLLRHFRAGVQGYINTNRWESQEKSHNGNQQPPPTEERPDCDKQQVGHHGEGEDHAHAAQSRKLHRRKMVAIASQEHQDNGHDVGPRNEVQEEGFQVFHQLSRLASKSRCFSSFVRLS